MLVIRMCSGIAGPRAATESPESSADGVGAKGLGGFTAISSEEPGTSRGGMPKSASTSHLSGLHSGVTSQAVRPSGNLLKTFA